MQIFVSNGQWKVKLEGSVETGDNEHVVNQVRDHMHYTSSMDAKISLVDVSLW